MSAMEPEDAAPILSVRELTVEFVTRRGTLRALDRISFDVARGEVLGVVGESGAGKSVTGSAIIGLIDPPGRIAGGEVRLSGERIDDLPDEAMRKVRGKRIGMIFQDPLTSLNPLYRISEQLIETIRVHTDLDGQVVDGEDRGGIFGRHRAHLSFGLSASRSQSPNRLIDKASRTSTSEGNSRIHHSPEKRYC